MAKKLHDAKQMLEMKRKISSPQVSIFTLLDGSHLPHSILASPLDFVALSLQEAALLQHFCQLF